MRQQLFTGILLLSQSLLLQACSGSTAEPVLAVVDELDSNANWEQSRYTARHTGNNPYESTLVSSTVGSAHVVFKVSTQALELMQHGPRIFSLSNSGLMALDASDGDLVWSNGEDVLGKPAFNAGQVFVTGYNDLFGYRVTDGAQKSAFGPAATDATVSNPVTRDDFVYVGFTSAENTLSPGYVAGRRIKGNGVPSFLVGLSFRNSWDPAVANGRLFVTGETNTAALDALTGALVWQSTTGSELFGPVVSGGRVLLQTATELIALKESTGAVLWRTALPGAPSGDMAVTSDRIFVPSATAAGVRLSVFSLSDGSPSFTTTVGTSTLTGDLAVGGDVLWLGENNGTLYAASVANGATLASFDLSQGGQSNFINDPIVSNGHVYVSNTKTLFALGLEPPIAAVGADGNGPSAPVFDVSADGRFVTFTSAAGNLVAGDSNNRGDVFTFDRVKRTTAFTCPTQPSAAVNAVTPNHRFLVMSPVEALVPSDTNQVQDIYVHDCQTGLSERVSMNANGTQATESSFRGSITPDGRYVVFISRAALVPGDSNGLNDVYVFDRSAGTIERVSVTTTGAQSNRDASTPSISDDGRFVAFNTSAALAAGETDTRNDVFVRDRTLGVTGKVSLTSAGLPANGQSIDATISANGRYVGFWSEAPNLGVSAGKALLFVRDRVAGTTESVTPLSFDVASTGSVPVFSPDARYVGFATRSGATPGVYLADRIAHTVELVSVNAQGQPGNAIGSGVAFTPNAAVVAFVSGANNLVPNDRNLVLDVFARDRVNGSVERVSVGLP